MIYSLIRKINLLSLIFIYSLSLKAQTAESDSLYSAGMNFFNSGNYDLSAINFKKAWENDSINIAKDSPRYENSKDWWAYTEYKKNYQKLAANISPISFDIPPHDRRLSLSIDNLISEYLGYCSDYMFYLAEEPLKSALKECEKIVGKNNSMYLSLLKELSWYYVNERNFKKGLEYVEKLEKSIETINPQSPYYKGIVNLIKGEIHLNENEYSQALKECKIAKESLSGLIRYAPLEYGRMVNLFTHIALEGGAEVWTDWNDGASPAALKELEELIFTSAKEYFGLSEEEQAYAYSALYWVINAYFNFPGSDFDKFNNMTEKYISVLRNLDRSLFKQADDDLGGILLYHGRANLSNNSYQKAEESVVEALNLFKKSNLSPERYTEAYLTLAQILASMGKEDKAIENLDIVINKAADYRNNIQYLLFEALPLKCNLLQKMGRGEEAVELIKQYSPLIISLQSSFPLNTANLLTDFSVILSWSTDNSDEIQDMLQKAIDIYESTGDEISYPYYYDAALSLLRINPLHKDKDKIIDKLTEALEKDYPGNPYIDSEFRNSKKIYLLITEAFIALKNNQPETSLSIIEKAIQNLQNSKINNSESTYYDLLSTKREVLAEIQDFAAVINTDKEIIDLSLRLNGEYHPSTISAKVNLISDFSAILNYDEADTLIKEIDNLIEMGLPGTNDYVKFNTLMTLSTVFTNRKDNEKALLYLEKIPELIPTYTQIPQIYYSWLTATLKTKAMTTRKGEINLNNLEPEFAELLNSNSHPYMKALLLVDMAKIAVNMNNWGKATKWFEMAYELLESNPELLNNLDFLTGISEYSSLLLNLGKMEESMKFYKIYIDALQNIVNRDNPLGDIVELLSTILNMSEGDIDTTQKLLREMCESEDSQNPGSFLSQNLHYVILSLKLPVSSTKEDFISDWEYFRKIKDLDKKLHPNFLLSLFPATVRTGMIEEATELEQELLKIPEREFKDTELINLYSLRSELAFLKQDIASSNALLTSAFNMARSFVLDNFLSMSEEERVTFWNSSFNFFKMTIPQAAMLNRENETFAELAYDNALFANSILLSSANTINDIASSSKDSKVKKAYKNFINSKNKLSLAEKSLTNNSSPSAEIISAFEQLKKNYKEDERSLLKLLNDKFGDYNKLLAISSSEVKKALKPSEIAIEFLEIPFLSPEEKHYTYLAAINSPEADRIELIPLFSLNENEDFKNCLDSELLADNIWKPLLPYLDDVTDIWFSPQGNLSVVPLESLPGIENLIFDKNISLHRLTSTRQLAVERLYTSHRNSPKNKTYVAYGDIDFSASSKEVKEADKKRKVAKRYVSLFERGTNREFDGIDALPGTGDEARHLSQLVETRKIGKPDLLCDIQATEASFKDLENKKPYLIHLGTHGFYADSSQETKNNFLSPEENAMHNSGLLFAGAELGIFSPEAVPAGSEDGVLTADEISGLDLSSTELIVLSACETGLGKIGADGVFGLQRGFKKAGANALMMSLWKVDDDATTSLMNNFYDAWLIEGLSKTQALQKAKEIIRNTPGWENPLYWASFILLDDLN